MGYWIPAFAGMTQSVTPPVMAEARVYYVYILASGLGGTLYIGVTNNLIRRVYEHKEKLVKGFTKRYDVVRLVYFEEFGEIGAAIQREKQMKNGTGRGRSSASKKEIRIGTTCIQPLPPLEVTGCPPSRA